MHNSLFIRDLLKKTNQSPDRIARRDAHRLIACDPAATAADGEFELIGAWRVECDAPPDVAQLIIADLNDFLARLGIATKSDAEQRVLCTIKPELGIRNYRLALQPHEIVVEGGDIAGLWAGVAALEWEMRTRRGPLLPQGEYSHQAAWRWQISQGPWGGNYSVPDFSPEYLSDDAFRLYAHYGVNSMMIYGDLLCYVQSTLFPELNTPDYERNIAMLKDAAQRAARYGVQFSYVVVGPKLRRNHPLFARLREVRGTGFSIEGDTIHCLCSGHELTHAFYDEFFTNLFREVPELAGLILIVGGESFYHCHIWRSPAEMCSRCAHQTTEQNIATITGVVQRAVQTAQPQAYVAAWAYNVFGWERPDRIEFARGLPPGVAMFHHIEKDQLYQKDGYSKRIWDYSIDYCGPSDGMTAMAEIAKADGRPLFVKTETGIGLEVFQFPYVPALPHLADKWQRVRGLQPDGVHQSWLFFGMFGSRAEELGFWAAYRDDMERDEFLHRIAVRDFGPDAAPLVLESWRQTSEAVRHLPCICIARGFVGLIYYIGPSFLGPAHPLVPHEDDAIPDVFHAHLFYLQEVEESFSRKTLEELRVSLALEKLPQTARELGMEWEGDGDGWDIVLREYSVAVSTSRAAWQALCEAQSLTRTQADATQLKEELLLSELFYRTMLSSENTVRFLLARRALERTGDEEQREEMRRIARVEMENARDAIHIFRDAPWLDLCERTDGYFPSCIAMIEEKLRWTERFLSNESHAA